VAEVMIKVPGGGYCAYYPYGLRTGACRQLRERQFADLSKTARCGVFGEKLFADGDRWRKCEKCLRGGEYD